MNGAVSKFETPITSHGLSLFIIICNGPSYPTSRSPTGPTGLPPKHCWHSLELA
jgi:hypothetical protein